LTILRIQNGCVSLSGLSRPWQLILGRAWKAAPRQQRLQPTLNAGAYSTFAPYTRKLVDWHDFPNDILMFYNRFSQAEEESFTKQEVLNLRTLLPRFFPNDYPEASTDKNKREEAHEVSYSQMETTTINKKIFLREQL
jgi:hypothetical protein